MQNGTEVLRQLHVSIAVRKGTMQGTVGLRGRMIPPRAMIMPNRWRVVGGSAQPAMCQGITLCQGCLRGNPSDVFNERSWVTLGTNVPYLWEITK